jgi:hypothetical protein
LRELAYRRAVDRDIWGAIPFAERQDHVADADTLAVAIRLRNLLGGDPARMRILVNAKTPHEVLRLIYLLLPLNASGIGSLANARSSLHEGAVIVNYKVDRPRPLTGVLRIGGHRVRVKVIDRNEDLVVYRVEAVLR